MRCGKSHYTLFLPLAKPSSLDQTIEKKKAKAKNKTLQPKHTLNLGDRLHTALTWVPSGRPLHRIPQTHAKSSRCCPNTQNRITKSAKVPSVSNWIIPSAVQCCCPFCCVLLLGVVAATNRDAAVADDHRQTYIRIIFGHVLFRGRILPCSAFGTISDFHNISHSWRRCWRRLIMMIMLMMIMEEEPRSGET